MRPTADLITLCRQRLAAVDSAELQSHLNIIERDPTNPAPIHTLALTCRRRGYLDIWQHAIDTAISLPHDTHEQLHYRGHSRIRSGDWAGWADRESRLFHPKDRECHATHMWQIQWTKVAWDGKEDLRGKTLFAFADGGFGDCLQMLRFIPSLAKTADAIVLGVRPELVSFVKHNLGHLAMIVSRDDGPAVPFQRYTWTMSLPWLLGELTPFAAISAPNPIIQSASEHRPLLVGLCWAGNPRHPRDRHRSMSIEAFGRLLARKDIRWQSLQVGERAAEVVSHECVRPPSQPLQTFADTANLIAGLDCVVTVDTSVAHLAGCLGVPTYLLLNLAAEFRWGLDDMTPWYPSMRLIRQRTAGDWAGVVSALAAELDLRTSGRTISLA